MREASVGDGKSLIANSASSYLGTALRGVRLLAGPPDDALFARLSRVGVAGVDAAFCVSRAEFERETVTLESNLARAAARFWLVKERWRPRP